MIETEWVRPTVKPSNPYPFLAFMALLLAGVIAWKATEPPIVPIVLAAPTVSWSPTNTPSGPTATSTTQVVIIASFTATAIPTPTVTDVPPIYCRAGEATPAAPCEVPWIFPSPATSTPLPDCQTQTPSGKTCIWRETT